MPAQTDCQEAQGQSNPEWAHLVVMQTSLKSQSWDPVLDQQALSCIFCCIATMARMSDVPVLVLLHPDLAGHPACDQPGAERQRF